MNNEKLRKILYSIYILLVILIAIVILSPNIPTKKFIYALLGLLLIISSIFGLLTKSIFLGRAFIFPYESKSIFTVIANYIIGFVGISFIVFNIISNYF